MFLRTALKQKRGPSPHTLKALTEDEVRAKRAFIVAEILRVFEAVLMDVAVVPQSQIFHGCKNTTSTKADDWSPWFNELPWTYISITACVPKIELSGLISVYAVSDAFRCKGFRVASFFETTFRIVPLTVCVANTVKELDLLWSLGLTHWKTKYFRMLRGKHMECSCNDMVDDSYCAMHSHAALVECCDNLNATWVALRKRWTPLRGSWIAACVAC
jgi:hypothetical protein